MDAAAVDATAAYSRIFYNCCFSNKFVLKAARSPSLCRCGLTRGFTNQSMQIHQVYACIPLVCSCAAACMFILALPACVCTRVGSCVQVQLCVCLCDVAHMLISRLQRGVHEAHDSVRAVTLLRAAAENASQH